MRRISEIKLGTFLSLTVKIDTLSMIYFYFFKGGQPYFTVVLSRYIRLHCPTTVNYTYEL